MAMLCLGNSHAQGVRRVRFQVIDSFLGQKMEYAGIILSRAKDSILVGSCRTNKEGYCYLSVRDSLRYRLKVFYPGYVDYSKVFESEFLPPDTSFTIILEPITHFLKEVVVANQVARMRMKGDTIEFRADSFPTDKNASVEDLLKKLPGISVDRNGNLSAFGRQVEKLMIDGEEYFSEDPALVTKSLRSNIVQKVQVFDKESDQAAFSKVKDSRTAKTINLELKPDKKKGYFGKIEGGINFGSFYDNQLMINRFNGEQKMAVFLIHSDIGKTGLNWQDTRSYSDFALSSEESSGFGSPQVSVLENWEGTYQNKGIPRVLTGGALYNDKFGKEVSGNASYRYYNMALDVQSSTTQQYLLGNTLYRNRQNSSINNSAISNRGILKTILQISKSGTLILGLDAGSNEKIIDNRSSSALYSELKGKLNSQRRLLNAKGGNSIFNASLLWQQKLKGNSTFSLSTKILYNRNKFSGNITANDSLFSGNLFQKDSVTDQFKNDAYSTLSFNAKAIFTYRFNNLSSMAFSVDYTCYKSYSQIASFNKRAGGDYAIADSLHSGNYHVRANNLNLGVNYVFANTRLISTTYLAGGISFLNQFDAKAVFFAKTRPLFFPQTTLEYIFNRQHKLIFDYSGASILPQPGQLQPILSNADPLNQHIGNPSLAAAFRNTFMLAYYDFKTEKNVSISFGGSYSFDINGFSIKDTQDSNGARTYSMLNLSKNKRLSIYSYYNCKLFGKRIDLNVSASVNGSEQSKMVNDQNILTRSITYGVAVNPSVYKQDKIYAEFNTSVRYNVVFSYAPDLQKESYLIVACNPSVSINISRSMVFKSDLFATRYPASRFYGSAQSISLLNLSLSQNIFKQQPVVFQLSVKNLLNNETGLTRVVSDNYSSQSSYNTIGRYFMVSVGYLFSQTIKPKTK